MKKLILLFFTFFFVQTAFALDDYKITVRVKNYDQDKLILAHYVGSKIFVDDTASIADNGSFIFDGGKDLAAGIYLLVTPPENKFVEIFLTEEEKNFNVSLDATKLTEDVVFEKAPDNTLFYEYLGFMRQTRPEMEALIKTIQEGKEGEKDIKKEEHQLEKLK